MSKLPHFFMLVLIILSTACRNNCESEETGSIDLNEVSKSYVTYPEGTTLTFENEEGETMKFLDLENVTEAYQICVKYLCENTSDPFQPTPCEYYTAQGIRNVFRSEDETMILGIGVSTENYEEESTLFYDVFSIDFNEIGTLADGKYIPHVHFTSPALEPDKTIIERFLVESETLTLHGLVYEDVLHTEEAENMVYYKKDIGIIGVKLNGVDWKIVD